LSLVLPFFSHCGSGVPLVATIRIAGDHKADGRFGFPLSQGASILSLELQGNQRRTKEDILDRNN
jgi:hypothetical protein